MLAFQRLDRPLQPCCLVRCEMHPYEQNIKLHPICSSCLIVRLGKSGRVACFQDIHLGDLTGANVDVCAYAGLFCHRTF